MRWAHGAWAYARRARRGVDYQSAAEFEREDAWYKAAARAAENVDYSEALGHARNEYARLLEASVGMDRKAEWTLGLASGAVGVLFATGQGTWAAIPGLVLLAVSMLAAVRCRMPCDHALPLSTRAILELLAEGGNDKYWLAASLHCAYTGTAIVLKWKAKLVWVSGGALVCGILALLPAWMW